jgi:hypothetical protein
MAETQTQQTSGTEGQQGQQSQEGQQQETGQQQEPKQRGNDVDVEAMQRALKKANKEAETYRLKVKEFEDASKSDQEKLTEKLTEQEQRALRAEQSALRMEVALEKHLPAKLVARLQGSTKEELLADADDLLATVGVRRTPDFDGGSRQTAPEGEGSFLAQALRNRRG